MRILSVPSIPSIPSIVRSGVKPIAPPTLGGVEILDLTTANPVSEATVGQGLSANMTDYDNYDTFTFQWSLDGNPISGADEIIYVAENVGQLTVTATLYNEGGSASATSDPVTVKRAPVVIDPAETQIYIDFEDVAPGEVTTLTTRGELAVTFTANGTGDPVTADEDGLHFSAGQYLRCTTGLPATEYARATIILDMTIDGDPQGTPYLMWLDGSPQGSLCQARYGNKDTQVPSAGFLMNSYGPGNTPLRSTIYKPEGHRFTTSHEFDFEIGEMNLIDEDGSIETIATTGDLELMVMTDLRIGQNSRVTIHRLAVMLEPSE